jgi:YHS domain-containing protein
MRNMLMIFLGLLLSLSVAGAGFAAAAPAAGQAQTVCPVLGNKIDKKVYVDYQGQRVYFCCTGCVEPFKKNPAQYLKKLEESGVTPEKAPAGK